MKPAFCLVGKEGILPELVKNLVYGLNMKLSEIFGINEGIIQVYNNKNI